MSTVEATDKESRAVARARKKADRIRDKHANDLPRSMQPSALVKTITIVVLVFALIYFLFPIYWAIIASTKTPSQMTGSNGLWFAVGLSDLPAAIAKNYGTLIGWTRGQFWRWVLNFPDLLGCFRSGGYARGCDGGIRYRKVQLQG